MYMENNMPATSRMKKGIRWMATIAIVVLAVWVALWAGSNMLSSTFSSLNVSDQMMPGLPSPSMEMGGADYYARDDGYGGDYEESIVSKTTSNSYEPETVNAQSVAQSESARQIIRRGAATIVAKDTAVTLDTIAAEAEAMGGYVERRRLDDINDQTTRGTITIRIPSTKFDEAMSVIRNAAVQVVHEDVTTEDVTDQMVDLGARLRNEQAQEERYLDILKRAGKIEDILMVETRLSQTRNNIERMVAQMESYKRRVAYSSIAVTVTSEADVEVLGVVWSPLVKIKLGFNQLLENLASYVDFLIALAFALPVLLLWVATALIALYIVVRLARTVYGRVMTKRGDGVMHE